MTISDRLFNLPVTEMALIVFAGTYAVVAVLFWAVTRLAVDDRARAFKALSPGMLPPLGIIFGLLVSFIAVQVWSDFERAKFSVANEASALRSVWLLAGNLPAEPQSQLRSSLSQQIDVATSQEWPAMAHRRATLTTLPTHLIEALETTLALTPTDEGQKLAQREIVNALQIALDARRQRIIISQSSVSAIKWTGLLLQALCTLIAIAMVHSDNRLTCGIALALFSTGVAVSILLIASYNRPFTGQISIGPELLMQVIPNDTTR